MRATILRTGLAAAAVVSAALIAPAPASASVTPDLTYSAHIRDYWGSSAWSQCNAQGRADTASNNPFDYQCDEMERQLVNGTWQIGYALWEDFLVG